MKHLWNCRRTGLAFFGMTILGAVLFMDKADTSMAIAGIVTSVAAANSFEKSSKSKLNKPRQRK